jgi:hypothetical protein
MIKVTDRFYINASSNCYTLQEKTTVQDEKSQNFGKEIFKDLGYYTTIESCLQGILKTTTREFIAQEQENSIKELLIQVKMQTEFLKNLKLDI